MLRSNLNLTFITNDADGSLPKRLMKILRSTRYFDVLVRYLDTSGFSNLYHSLENIEKTRVIVGQKIDEHTSDIYCYDLHDESLYFRSCSEVRNQLQSFFNKKYPPIDHFIKKPKGIRQERKYLQVFRISNAQYRN